MNYIVLNLLGANNPILAIGKENPSDFLQTLQENLSNPILQTEAGRIDTHKQARSVLFGVYQDEMPYNVQGNMAIIPIHGGLLNRFNSSWGFVTGYGYIKQAVSAALSNDNIEKIILDVNSVGGEAAGCFETAQFIKEASQHKPIYAVVDSLCLSAAYMIASAATKIYATPTSTIGSIGVVLKHFSYEKMLNDDGVEVTLVQAGDKKTLGNPYKDLSDSDKAELQKSVNDLCNDFTRLVSENRSISEESITKMQAACYTSAEAKAQGLIDGIDAVEKTLQSLIKSLPKKENDMGAKDTPQATDVSAQAEAQASVAESREQGKHLERERIGAILNADAAKNNAALANHFAFNTNLSASDAIAAMEAASVDKAVTNAKAETPPQNLLAEAMAKQGSPNVAPDGENESSDDFDISAIAEFVSKE